MVSFSFTAPRTTEDELIEERNLLSVEQRELDEADLYGSQGTEIVESEDETAACLHYLRQMLASDELVMDSSTPLHQAMERCPDYVISTDFLIMFLRAERFDSNMAFKRICMYWKVKIDLFGDEAFHILSGHDLSDDDMSSLQLGGLFVLPNKDEAGRAIIISDRSKWELRQSHRKSFARAYWFTIHHALSDVETQKKGFVIIVGMSRTFSLYEFDRKVSNLIMSSTYHALPIRIVAVHNTLQSKIVQLIQPFIWWAMGKEARRKFSHHCGPKNVIIGRLASEFGIDADSIPQEFGGTFDFNYEVWLREVLLAEGL